MMTAALLQLYGPKRKLLGLGMDAGRPVAFLEVGDCEGACRTMRVTLTSAGQAELASLSLSERIEVADFLANQGGRAQ